MPRIKTLISLFGCLRRTSAGPKRSRTQPPPQSQQAKPESFQVATFDGALQKRSGTFEGSIFAFDRQNRASGANSGPVGRHVVGALERQRNEHFEGRFLRARIFIRMKGFSWTLRADFGHISPGTFFAPRNSGHQKGQTRGERTGHNAPCPIAPSLPRERSCRPPTVRLLGPSGSNRMSNGGWRSTTAPPASCHRKSNWRRRRSAARE